MSVVRKIASKVLPHHGNAKLTAPPGRIPNGEGRPVLVKSKMRSGTHLLIDLILNNFPQLRTESLYVELDHAFHQGITAEKFSNLGKCLCKTHFGGKKGQELRSEITQNVVSRAYIIEPVRDLEQMKPSLRNFLSEQEFKDYLETCYQFDRYWKETECLKISFNELISKEGNDSAIKKIAAYIGEEPSSKRYYNRSKQELRKVMLDKLLTRLRGVKQRRVNTTIQFNG